MYEQIVAQIQQAIWSGELPAGASLPSLRRLARDLEVSLITTTRAYNDLAAAGLIANQACLRTRVRPAGASSPGWTLSSMTLSPPPGWPASTCPNSTKGAVNDGPQRTRSE